MTMMNHVTSCRSMWDLMREVSLYTCWEASLTHEVSNTASQVRLARSSNTQTPKTNECTLNETAGSDRVQDVEEELLSSKLDDLLRRADLVWSSGDGLRDNQPASISAASKKSSTSLPLARANQQQQQSQPHTKLTRLPPRLVNEKPQSKVTTTAVYMTAPYKTEPIVYKNRQATKRTTEPASSIIHTMKNANILADTIRLPSTRSLICHSGTPPRKPTDVESTLQQHVTKQQLDDSPSMLVSRLPVVVCCSTISPNRVQALSASLDRLAISSRRLRISLSARRSQVTQPSEFFLNVLASDVLLNTESDPNAATGTTNDIAQIARVYERSKEAHRRGVLFGRVSALIGRHLLTSTSSAANRTTLVALVAACESFTSRRVLVAQAVTSSSNWPPLVAFYSYRSKNELDAYVDAKCELVEAEFRFFVLEHVKRGYLTRSSLAKLITTHDVRSARASTARSILNKELLRSINMIFSLISRRPTVIL